MTTFCRIVLMVVSCTVDPLVSRPSPQEAAQVLTASIPPAAPAWRLELYDLGEGLVPPPAYDRTWPFSTTTSPTFAPSLTRLDGSSMFLPPVVYGAAPYTHGGFRRHGSNVYYPMEFQRYRDDGLDRESRSPESPSPNPRNDRDSQPVLPSNTVRGSGGATHVSTTGASAGVRVGAPLRGTPESHRRR